MIQLRPFPYFCFCLSHLLSLSLWILVLGVAARETAQALKTLAQAARGVAASTTDPKAAAAMLDSARDVMEGSALLIHEAKEALICPGDAESQQRLAQVRSLREGGVYSAHLVFITLRWLLMLQEDSVQPPEYCQTKADSKIEVIESSVFYIDVLIM